ncbi:ABC transporter substrate-binding protein [Mariniluteicoccus endophyticus]
MDDGTGPARTSWRAGPVLRPLVPVLAGVLALSGCTPATVPGPDGSPSPVPSGEVTIQGCTPARNLLPANTTDACGLRITEAITARLVRTDPGGAPVMDLASAIDTTDQRTFTVHLRPDRTFADGTPVRARNFVSAWNWAARGTNGMAGASLFGVIEGARALRCSDMESCDVPGDAEMTGLKVVDDHTFTMTTTRPVTDLPARLDHPAFAPLPDAFFAEGGTKEAYATRPIGAGPFTLVSASTTQVVLERNDAYTGPAPAKVRRVVVRLYDDPARGLDVQKAYDDVVAGRLDFTGVVPTDMLLDDQWKTDLKDRWAQADTRTPVTLDFLGADRQLAGNPDLRRAISRAIDRETASRRIFQGTRVPATSWVPPAVPGYATDACGELCTFDLSAARQAYDDAGGYVGAFYVTVSADSGNKEWADSLCNQLASALEINCQVRVLPNQKTVLEQVEEGRLTGVVRQETGSVGVSPGPYLIRYRSDSSANVTGHRDLAYDELLDRAAAAATPEEALALYRQAEGRLAVDPPSIPLWYASTPVGWSTRLADVRLTRQGALDLSEVRVR